MILGDLERGRRWIVGDLDWGLDCLLFGGKLSLEYVKEGGTASSRPWGCCGLFERTRTKVELDFV